MHIGREEKLKSANSNLKPEAQKRGRGLSLDDNRRSATGNWAVDGALELKQVPEAAASRRNDQEASGVREEGITWPPLLPFSFY